MLACPRGGCHAGLVDAGEQVRETAGRPAVLLRRGRLLEWVTLGWNVAGIAVLAVAALAARSVALAGFGLDSLIEIGASAVVLWELSGAGEDRQRRALRLIGGAFVALAAYLVAQSALVLASGYRPGPSMPGIIWTALTAAAMFALAAMIMAISAAAMAFSSVFVVTSSLRLRRFRPRVPEGHTRPPA
jgi:hypothetical protein